jgi:hypothetical protein
MPAALASRPLRLASSALVALLVTSSGCYWHWSNAQDDPFPNPVQSDPIPLTAGLTLSGLSNAPQAPEIPPSAVIQALAERLSEDKVFEVVVYPLTSLARVEPDVVFDVTVRIEEHQHWAENIVKAILTGLTLLLLGPALPTHYTVVVDLSAEAAAGDGGSTPIGTYRYRSEYDYYYTTMTPSGTKMEEWLKTAQGHAVEDVIGQIKRDRHRFLAIPPRAAR